MAYVKQNWENLPNRTTPISAQRLNHLETQYDEAKDYTDTEIQTVVENSLEIQRENVNQMFSHNPRYSLSGVMSNIQPVTLHNSLPTIVESTTREFAVFPGASNSWRESKLSFQRLGNKVFVTGHVRRVDTNGDIVKIDSGAVYSNVGFISETLLPDPDLYYELNNTRRGVYLRGIGNGAHTLQSVGQTSPASVRINKNGYLFIYNGSTEVDYDYITVNDVYDAQDAVWLNPLDHPEFDGTYYKNWYTNTGMVEGINYSVVNRQGVNPGLSTLSIHTGQGEYGAETCARVFAEHHGASLYYIDAVSGGYSANHPSANRFDDPRAVSLVRDSTRCVSFHGAVDIPGYAPGTSFIGGLDLEMKDALISALNLAGFPATDSDTGEFPNLAGFDPRNICNQTKRNGGVQIEMDNTLRQSFFTGGDASRSNRINTTPVLQQYLNVISSVTNQMLAQDVGKF